MATFPFFVIWFLHHLTSSVHSHACRSGTLYRRFWFAGEPAVDLLSRLLTFDPSRRCRAEEAMMHELFFVFWDIPLEDYDNDPLATTAGGKASSDEEVTQQLEDMAIETDSPTAFENPPTDEGTEQQKQ